MQVDRTKSFRDESGMPVDDVYLTGGEYSRVRRKRLEGTEDTFLIIAERRDGDVERHVFEGVPERFRGIAYRSGDRRDVPNDIQDALLSLGFAVRANVSEETESEQSESEEEASAE